MNLTTKQQTFLFESDPTPAAVASPVLPHGNLEEELANFTEFGKETVRLDSQVGVGEAVPTYVNEFWTSKQRAASRLHEISYRACFKPQVPRFFIERLSRPGEVVYDPFMGRGTTCLEAALLGRIPAGCDINPVSQILLEPRLQPPLQEDVARRLTEIDFDTEEAMPEELLVFYHPTTLRAIGGLRVYLKRREEEGTFDGLDGWIRMVAINRLTGHAPGFFSVYTLPPNQAASVKSQRRINEKRQQTPPERDVPALILKKSRALLKEFEPAVRAQLAGVADQRHLMTAPAAKTPELPSGSVSLVVTSPPFLDVVDYAGDNWMRLWFCGIDAQSLEITVLRKLEKWEAAMEAVFNELGRVLCPGGHVAFEVGEVRGGKIKLEEAVVRSARKAGLVARLILINDQKFTKTANCWGVDNGAKGTNTNRIVLLQKKL
jgi:hypothetical protein